MTSIVNYPERGIGGKNSYRGNCSPKLIVDLQKQFGFQSICDYMAGSYTTEDAAKELGIESHCYDLNHGFDLRSMEIPERSEFTFWHPPYGTMIQYSDSLYSAKEVMDKYGIDSNKADLSRIQDWDEFIRVLNQCLLKQYAALDKGGRIAVLMGDYKKKGRCYSMIKGICVPGTLENIVIKVQNNCVSDRTTYSGKFIPIVHEYLMICKKAGGLYVPVAYTRSTVQDMRDLHCVSWKDALYEFLKEKGETLSLEAIYSRFDGHKKTENNPHWRDKIRQTLQRHPELFRHVERGCWAAA